ncbi:MAG: DNA repair exonuclease [Candidatus Latescibacter sp.]|nr:DNA repair exonuclease [Candidatus Latescibacter sp.]
MIKFIHAADIHLDSPLCGLSRYDGAPEEEIRQSTRKALENLVANAIEDKVNFVLISGDLYDGNWKDHNTGLYFTKQMSELRKADIKVFIIAGNHDAQSVMTKCLKLPDNVYQFSTKHPETQHLDNIGVVIHGQGFPTQAVTRDLSMSYPPVVSNALNIGMLHTSINGREGHDNYAPCTVEGLVQRGYDYWALGHVHNREQIEAEQQIWFPGNIQGRHIQETGSKGCLLVTVDDSREVSVEFRELDVLRWDKLYVDVSKAQNPDDCLDFFRNQLSNRLKKSNGHIYALRVIVTGESVAHESISSRPTSFLNDIRSIAIDHGDGNVWIEKLVISTRPDMMYDKVQLEGPLGELSQIFDSFHTDESALKELINELDPLIKKLPHELCEGMKSLDMEKPEKMKVILRQVQPMLLTKLRDPEATL